MCHVDGTKATSQCGCAHQQQIRSLVYWWNMMEIDHGASVIRSGEESSCHLVRDVLVVDCSILS